MAESHRKFIFFNLCKSGFFIEFMCSDSVARCVKHNLFKSFFFCIFHQLGVKLATEMYRLALIFFIYKKLFKYGNIFPARHNSYGSYKLFIFCGNPEIAAGIYVRIRNCQQIGLVCNGYGRACSVILKVKYKVYNVLRILLFKLNY